MSRRNRRGVALFAALALLGFIGLLVGGALASLTLAQRSSQLGHADADLMTAADFAVHSAIADASALRLDTLPLGAQTMVVRYTSMRGVETTVTAARLPHGVAWLVADAEASGIAGGSRRVNVVARWPMPGPMPESPIVSRGSVRLRSAVTFDADASTDADCRAPFSAAVSVGAGAIVSSPDSVAVSSGTASSDSSTYLLAPSQVARVATGGGVMHVDGDTTIAGGSFTGILIVEGRLVITGPFAASGLVISRGPVVATSGGLTITGALMSFAPAVPGEWSIDVGSAVLRYSRCAIWAAVRRAVPLRPARARGWAELF